MSDEHPFGRDGETVDVVDAMDLSPNRIDKLRYAAEDKLLAAEARGAVRPRIQFR